MLSSDRLSVRMSHGWIGQIQLKLGYCNFHRPCANQSICSSIFIAVCRLPVHYTVSSVCPSDTQVDSTRQHICYRRPSVLPLSSVTRMYQSKTVKVSIMQFSSPIHLSVYPTISPSVYPCFCLYRPSAVCQCAICCRPSVHLSVCPSVTCVNQSKHGWI